MNKDGEVVSFQVPVSEFFDVLKKIKFGEDARTRAGASKFSFRDSLFVLLIVGGWILSAIGHRGSTPIWIAVLRELARKGAMVFLVVLFVAAAFSLSLAILMRGDKPIGDVLVEQLASLPAELLRRVKVLFWDRSDKQETEHKYLLRYAISHNGIDTYLSEVGDERKKTKTRHENWDEILLWSETPMGFVFVSLKGQTTCVIPHRLLDEQSLQVLRMIVTACIPEKRNDRPASRMTGSLDRVLLQIVDS